MKEDHQWVITAFERKLYHQRLPRNKLLRVFAFWSAWHGHHDGAKHNFLWIVNIENFIDLRRVLRGFHSHKTSRKSVVHLCLSKYAATLTHHCKRTSQWTQTKVTAVEKHQVLGTPLFFGDCIPTQFATPCQTRPAFKFVNFVILCNVRTTMELAILSPA